MRILVLTSYVPYPPNAGAKIHVANQMRYLSQQHDVTLICPVRPGSEEARNAQKLVGRYCTSVRPVPWHKRSKIKFLPHLFRYIRAGDPIGDLIYYHEELADALHLLTSEQHFDIVNVHHNYMAPYLDAISPLSKCRTILTLHNVPYLQYHRIMLNESNLLRKLGLFRDWLFQKHSTFEHIRRYDKTIAISEIDRSIFLRQDPQANIVAVPTGIDIDELSLMKRPTRLCNIMFIGSMYYKPNIEAALFLCQEILPLIKQQIPDVHLFLVGSKPPKEVLRLGQQTEGVTVTGYVDSVIPYYEQSCLTLVPLRAGSGIRIKILESLALGRPVVSTTVGCEGLHLTHNQNILVADTPADLAAQAVRLMVDTELWQRIVSNGRRQVEQVYDWRATGRQLIRAFEET
ncbi:MAG: glycosyltransferase [Chloroflexi bacterium]|nr:glycosyltransferase [Chloroflexota bacterium]